MNMTREKSHHSKNGSSSSNYNDNLVTVIELHKRMNVLRYLKRLSISCQWLLARTCAKSVNKEFQTHAICVTHKIDPNVCLLVSSVSEASCILFPHSLKRVQKRK